MATYGSYYDDEPDNHDGHPANGRPLAWKLNASIVAEKSPLHWPKSVLCSVYSYLQSDRQEHQRQSHQKVEREIQIQVHRSRHGEPTI